MKLYLLTKLCNFNFIGTLCFPPRTAELSVLLISLGLHSGVSCDSEKHDSHFQPLQGGHGCAKPPGLHSPLHMGAHAVKTPVDWLATQMTGISSVCRLDFKKSKQGGYNPSDFHSKMFSESPQRADGTNLVYRAKCSYDANWTGGHWRLTEWQELSSLYVVKCLWSHTGEINLCH